MCVYVYVYVYIKMFWGHTQSCLGAFPASANISDPGSASFKTSALTPIISLQLSNDDNSYN